MNEVTKKRMRRQKKYAEDGNHTYSESEGNNYDNLDYLGKQE